MSKPTCPDCGGPAVWVQYAPEFRCEDCGSVSDAKDACRESIAEYNARFGRVTPLYD